MGPWRDAARFGIAATSCMIATPSTASPSERSSRQAWSNHSCCLAQPELEFSTPLAAIAALALAGCGSIKHVRRSAASETSVVNLKFLSLLAASSFRNFKFKTALQS
jgi:hypothetical protein